MTLEIFSTHKLVILGAGGFIGLGLAKSAIQQGLTVLCVSKSFQWEPALIAQNNQNLCFINANVQDVSRYINYIDESSNVVYMAGSTNLALAETQVGEDFLSHINSLSSFLLALNKAKSVIFLSSGGAVYGEPIGESSKEDDCLHPKSVYGKRNCMLETVFDAVLANKSIPYCILRVANPYGVDQLIVKRTGLIFSVIQYWMQGKTVSLRDQGLQQRDYISMIDLSMFILKLFSKGLNPLPRIINVGSGKSYNALEVVNLIRSTFDIDGPLQLVEDHVSYDVIRSRLDVTLLKQVSMQLNFSKDLFMPLEITLPKIDKNFLLSKIN